MSSDSFPHSKFFWLAAGGCLFMLLPLPAPRVRLTEAAAGSHFRYERKCPADWASAKTEDEKASFTAIFEKRHDSKKMEGRNIFMAYRCLTVAIFLMEKMLDNCKQMLYISFGIAPLPNCHRMVAFPNSFGIGSGDASMELPHYPNCHRMVAFPNSFGIGVGIFILGASQQKPPAGR
jgi:hypothetical protein